ncbi:Omega-ctenitoxin-Cs1a, partial [Cymbomonas tetramitiformis]
MVLHNATLSKSTALEALRWNKQLCSAGEVSHALPLVGQRRTNGQSSRRGTRQIVKSSLANTFGTSFRVTTFGESHGGGVGCVIDGVPPRVPITQEELQFELDRRRPGQSRITTPRQETDTCEILSGVSQDGVTLGTPIAVLVRNKDHRGGDYKEMSLAYRPSHADATYDFKYGVRAVQGGGRSSARETIGRVAAGALAKKILQISAGTE